VAAGRLRAPRRALAASAVRPSTTLLLLGAVEVLPHGLEEPLRVERLLELVEGLSLQLRLDPELLLDLVEEPQRRSQLALVVERDLKSDLLPQLGDARIAMLAHEDQHTQEGSCCRSEGRE